MIALHTLHQLASHGHDPLLRVLDGGVFIATTAVMVSGWLVRGR